MISLDAALYDVIERRLRRDRRLGLQRRIGERRDDGLIVSMERRGVASRSRERSDRRAASERRFRVVLLSAGIGSLLRL